MDKNKTKKINDAQKKSGQGTSGLGYFSLTRDDIFGMFEGLEHMLETYESGAAVDQVWQPKTEKPKRGVSRSATRLGAHTLTDENIFGMIESVGKMLKTTEDDTKKRKMSYSISPFAQALIKHMAENSGATQGNIVELSPLFFGVIVQKSLDRRLRGLETLELLKGQINSSLQAMITVAPHLECFVDHLMQSLEALVAMEKKAVAEKNYAGVNSKGTKSLPFEDNKSGEPPYYKEINELLGKDQYLQDILKRLVNA